MQLLHRFSTNQIERASEKQPEVRHSKKMASEPLKILFEIDMLEYP